MQKYSLRKSLTLIFLSTLVVSGGAFLFVRTAFRWQKRCERYTIRALVQRTYGSEKVPTLFLAERLGLSEEVPQNIISFSCHEGEARLYSSHIFKHVSIEKKKPSRLLIDYTLRKPVARLGDMTNTVVDNEGVCFPYLPFFSPRHLPEIIVGAPLKWGDQLELKQLTLMHDLLNLLKDQPLQMIDLSQVDAQSAGQRQIVLRLNQHLLRLSIKDYPLGLSQYRLLQVEEPSIIDLRLPQTAYLRKLR